MAPITDACYESFCHLVPLKIFSYVGITGENTKLFTTGIFGIVKLVSSLAAAFFIVDLLGRKFAVMAGLTIQAISALYLCLYLKFHYSETPSTETPSSKRLADVGIFFIFLSGFAWAIGELEQTLQRTEERIAADTNHHPPFRCQLCPISFASRDVLPRGPFAGCRRRIRRAFPGAVWFQSISEPHRQQRRTMVSIPLLLHHEHCFAGGEFYLDWRRASETHNADILHFASIHSSSSS